MRPVRLRFTAEAREHIAAIFSYLGDRNPVAAMQVVGRIRLATERLTEFPRMGHWAVWPAHMHG
jgi:toxin ParE1/3/4